MDNKETTIKGSKPSLTWLWIILIIIGVIIVITVILGIIYILRKDNQPHNPGCYNGDGPTEGQTSALRMTNHCCEPIWVEARAGACSGPLPGQSQTVFKVNPGTSIDFNIPPNGLAATRFWAKWGCDETGFNCLMGDQDPYWTSTETCPTPYGCTFTTCPTGPCPTNGCTPPIDTLFEATWGCNLDIADCNVNTSACTGGCSYRGCPQGGCTPLDNVTTFDMSQVDGWTFPYRLYIKGSTGDLASCNNNNGAVNINGSGLSLGRCPTSENLTDNGQFNTVTDPNGGQTFSTESVNLQYINQNQIVGCFSPCQKLTEAPPNGFGQGGESQITSPPTDMYCCPTPPITSSVCKAGPVTTTEYVTSVHSMAPGVYAYAYDDGVGQQNCPAVTVIYEVELCGQGAPAYPYPL